MNRKAIIALTIAAVAIVISASLFWYTSLPQEIQGRITDDLGRNITVGASPKRIVSMAPSVTEILFALDLGNKVVGVTDACDYPPEVAEIEKIAEFQNFQVERIVELNPDLVIMDRYLDLSPPGFWLSKLEEVGLKVVVLYARDLEDVISNIRLVGEATWSQAEAEKLADSLENRISVIKEKTENITDLDKPRVFSSGWYDGESDPWTSGIGTFADDMVKMAGGINIAGVKTGFFQMDLEAIVWANPQIVIVIEDYKWPTPTYDSLMNDERLVNIEAIQSNAIYMIDANLVSRPGPRLVDGLEEIAEILHPEIFK